uniref:Uncharacterized protein n=1 Tax=Anguilla anguilla TaxID=7936 RepID=A0A0E9U6G2_ANGAN
MFSRGRRYYPLSTPASAEMTS